MESLVTYLYRIPVLLVAFTVHELAHAATAYYFGDDTAKRAGRMTLNPLVHIDVTGALLLIIAGFGWAKPVPVNPMNLANPKRDIVWVSAAGPISNIIMAIISGIILKILILLQIPVPFLYDMFYVSFVINLILAIFNMIPLYPLDGSKVLLGLLPYDKAIKYDKMAGYGPQILLIVFISGALLGTSLLDIIFIPWLALWQALFGF